VKAPRLASLQRRFQEHLLAGGGELMQPLVHADAVADAPTRLDVYAQAYRLRLLEVLGKDYPALRRLLGAAEFDSLAAAYLRAHPSDTASVRWFGRHLPEFLQGRGGTPAAELARFEWSKGLVFDSPDAPPLEMAAIAALPAARWPRMRLHPQQAVLRMDLHWNAPAIFQACERGVRLPRPRRSDAPLAWLLWRDTAGDIRWRSLPPAEAAAWDAAAAGAAFGEICERLCEWVEAEEASMLAASLLKLWLADGLLAAVDA
jgi:hypothetical protein